tara:strand:- start:3586 stop:4722 length:1137 start_codon:yes stop_codon:yes gene_type:complete
LRITVNALVITVTLVLTPELLANESYLSQTKKILSDLNTARNELNLANSYRERVEALSKLIKETEKSLSDLRSAYRTIKLQSKNLNEDIILQKEKISELAGALLVVGREPLGSKILHPDGALNAARSSLILSDILEGVRSEAKDLDEDLEKLRLLTNLAQRAEQEMQISLKNIQAARVSLIKAASGRADLPIRFIEDPKKISLLSKSAKSLGEFAVAINSLEKKLIIPAEPIEKDFEGALNLPVEGIIARKFKEEDAAGIVRPGIIIRTKDNEIVTSPIISTILYAGPLLDYEMVSILEPYEGVLLILAGLDQVFVKPGQIIPKSGPIGLMGSRNTNSKNFITDWELNSGRLSQSLYIEVRVNDKPQDPFDWFDFNKE